MARKPTKIDMRVVVKYPSDNTWKPLPEAYYAGGRSVSHAATLIAASEGFNEGLQIRIMTAASGEVKQFTCEKGMAIRVPAEAL